MFLGQESEYLKKASKKKVLLQRIFASLFFLQQEGFFILIYLGSEEFSFFNVTHFF